MKQWLLIGGGARTHIINLNNVTFMAFNVVHFTGGETLELTEELAEQVIKFAAARPIVGLKPWGPTPMTAAEHRTGQ